MVAITEFLTSHIIEVYFIYGLGFFVLGLAIVLESGHASSLPLTRATPCLAGFGFFHAAAEWADMLIKVERSVRGGSPQFGAELLGVMLEGASFLCLLRFGCELHHLLGQQRDRRRCIILAVMAVYLSGLIVITTRLSSASTVWLKAVDAWTSYAIGLPAFFMTVWGLVGHSRQLVTQGWPNLSLELRGAAIALSWYGFFDSVIVGQAPFPPASFINGAAFLAVVGIPVQVFRAANALFITFFFIRALRIFAAEDRRRLEEALAAQKQLQQNMESLNASLQQAAREMSALYEQLRQRDEVHSYLLRRVVRAQEEERRRVARDLHDGVGQTLSGLAAALAALESRCQGQDSAVHQQIKQMQAFAGQSLEELHRVTTDLRPTLLDDLGLVAALRWYARQYTEALPLIVQVEVQGQMHRLPPEIEIVLFRIAQEALTNVVRHARANSATIRLAMDTKHVVLEVEDNGIGFDPRAAFAATGEHQPWGLLGMQERAALVNGTVTIVSEPWKGTRVTADIPLPPQQEREQAADARPDC